MDENQIKNLLQRNEIFKSATSAELDEIYNQSTIVEYVEHAVIINEGELADALYLILEGSVQIFTCDGNDELIILARLDEDKIFGEQAYFNNLIRTASIRAYALVKLLKINYDILDRLFKRSEKLREYLKSVSLDICLSNLLAKLSSIESYVKNLFLEKSFFSSAKGVSLQYLKKNDIIFKKGDAADLVYFISYGSISLSFDEDPVNNLIINKNEMFGEVGVMYDKPRSATAIASTDTRLIAVSGKNFIKAVKKANSLKSMVVAFNHVYALPKNRAIAEQFIGTFEGNEAIFTKYKLKDGTVAICAKVINQALFTIKISDLSATETITYRKGDFIQRSVSLANNKIVALTVSGEWDQINILCTMLFDGIKIHGFNAEDFTKHGSLIHLSSNSMETNREKDMICNCMSVTWQVLRKKIDEGCRQLEKLSEETGACTACGSCRNKILDMLGQSMWVSATLQLHQKFGKDIASFIIKPLYSQFVPFISGQYISLKLQINDLWIQRVYTLVSPQDNCEYYEVIIKKNSNGAFSQWLFEHAEENLFLWISLPDGKFLLNQSQNIPALGFAAGIGITPFIAFLRALKAKNSKQQFYIFYAVQNMDNLVMPDDIKEYLTQEKNIHVEIWDRSTKGLIDGEMVEKFLQQSQAEHIYLCGPDPFMKLITEKLKEMQFPSNNIFQEQFLPAV